MGNLASLNPGDLFEGLIVSISNISPKGQNTTFTVEDSSGKRNGYCSAKCFTASQLGEYKDVPVSIKGIYEAKLAGEAVIKVKAIEAVEQTTENNDKAWKNIDPAIIKFYLDKIRTYINAVKNPHYRALLEVFFAEKNVSLIKTMPATHTRQASAFGGMLQETAMVTAQCVSWLNLYNTYYNGLYSFKGYDAIDYDLLITGSLLHLCGNLLYFAPSQPHIKTDEGVNMGFSAACHCVISSFVREYGLIFEENELSSLLGVIFQCDDLNKSAKATCLEAIVLRENYHTFKAVDVFDHIIYDALDNIGFSKDNKKIKKYLFDSSLNCYVDTGALKRKSSSMKKNGIPVSDSTEEGDAT